MSDFRQEKKDDPPVNSLRTLSAPHPASYPVSVLKRSGNEASHSHTIRAQTNNAWSHTSTSPFIYMARSFNEHWDNFPVNFNWYTGN